MIRSYYVHQVTPATWVCTYTTGCEAFTARTIEIQGITAVPIKRLRDPGSVIAEALCSGWFVRSDVHLYTTFAPFTMYTRFANKSYTRIESGSMALALGY